MTVKKSHAFFSGLCFSTWVFCLLVILWGVWVRVSHSGDSCGTNWPDCNGVFFISPTDSTGVWIEWIHRAGSGLFGIVVLVLLGLAFKCFPPGHSVRKCSIWVLLFTVSEALIGARLVLSGLTGANTTMARVITMHAHLLNSLALVSSLFICWRVSLGKIFDIKKLFGKKQILFVMLFLILAFSGSVSSLAVSLFPSPSLWEGLMLDLNKASPWLLKWRIMHPLLALMIASIWIWKSPFQIPQFNLKKSVKIKSIFFNPQVLIGIVLLSGVVNLLFLSPVFLKLVHLLMVYGLVSGFLLSLEKSSL